MSIYDCCWLGTREFSVWFKWRWMFWTRWRYFCARKSITKAWRILLYFSDRFQFQCFIGQKKRFNSSSINRLRFASKRKLFQIQVPRCLFCKEKKFAFCCCCFFFQNWTANRRNWSRNRSPRGRRPAWPEPESGKKKTFLDKKKKRRKKE